MKLYPQIRHIPVLTLYLHVIGLIQHVNQLLLQILINLIVQRVDSDNLLEDFPVRLPDFRPGKGDYGNMLDSGAPLPVISETLGHQNINTTAIYLKIDLEGLRRCALDPEEVFHP